MTGPGLSRHAEPVAFDQPLLVVTPPELPKGVGELRDRGEMPHPQQVLLQGTNEPFGNAIALGLPHEARRAGHPQECQLPLEVMAHVGAAVIVADRWPGGDPLVEAAELFADALAERLQRLEPIARLGGVDADALAVQWSTAMKTQTWPSPVVTVVVMSVPQSSSGRSVTMVPSCAFGPWGWPTRCGACRPCCASDA